MKTFFLVLVHPIRAFREIKAIGEFSTMSLIVVLFLMLINSILMIPINEKITSTTFSSMPIADNQMDMMMQVTHKMRYLQVVGAEVLYIIMFLFYAILLCLLVWVAKDKLAYKNALQLIIYSYFIVAIGDLVNIALLYMRGLDAITNLYENSLIGLNMFTSIEQAGATFYSFLIYFTPFQLIFIILLSLGLKVYTEMKYVKSMIIIVLFWLVVVLIPTLSVYFSQLAIERTGIM
jgi:hypothetical protein